MIVAIHQPHFLPWLGYLNKVIQSEAFAILNTVQYRPRYYQNRAKIKRQETWQWLSIPVHADRSSRIIDVTIADEGWSEYANRTIEYTYHKTPYFAACWPLLQAALLQPEATLDGVNYNILLALLKLLQVDHVNLYRANELPVDADEPTDRLVAICKHLGATHYISGRGGREYMRVEAFAEAGIEIIYQDLDFNTLVYPQAGKTFVGGLSAIDCLFNNGPDYTRQLAEQAWVPPAVEQL